MSAVTHLVYRLYDGDDRLLYVGVTQDWAKRRQHHSVVQSWFPLVKRVELESCSTRQNAVAREASLIRTLSPPHNRQHKPPPPPPPPPDYTLEFDDVMTTKQAAEALKMTHGAVRRVIADGRMAAFKIGGSNRQFVTRQEVERYARERRPAGAPSGPRAPKQQEPQP